MKSLWLSSVDITDATLELLGKHCPIIEDLALEDCWDVTIDGFRSFVKQGTLPLELFWYNRWDSEETEELLKTLKDEFPRITTPLMDIDV